MARKELEDFDNDYQAFADYLESAECTNDEGIDIVADEKGNIYTPTDGDWTKGHGHENANSGWEGRDADDPASVGRKWVNRWLIPEEYIEAPAEVTTPIIRSLKK